MRVFHLKRSYICHMSSVPLGRVIETAQQRQQVDKEGKTQLTTFQQK